LSWRTWQRCLLEGWIEFSGRWPRSGMMLNGIAYRLPTLVPRMSGTGCSYWLTPTVNTAEHPGQVKHKPGQQLRLTQQVNNRDLWPKPDANCGNRGPAKDPAATHRPSGAQRQMTINDAVKMWPTPRAFMHKDSATDRGKSNLGEVVGGQLNPMWVEWLMGFPLGWTDLEDLETP